MTADEHDQAARAFVLSLIADASPSEDVMPGVLQAVCERLGWDVGIAWRMDRPTGALRFARSWCSPDLQADELLLVSERASFPAGVGLPGRIFASREPTWIEDVGRALSFPRAKAAAEAGIRSGFGLPVQHGRAMLGVLEFYSREARPRDDALLIALSPIGERLGERLAGEEPG